jgi:hypothetical protein
MWIQAIMTDHFKELTNIHLRNVCTAGRDLNRVAILWAVNNISVIE